MSQTNTKLHTINNKQWMVNVKVNKYKSISDPKIERFSGGAQTSYDILITIYGLANKL